MRGIYRDQEGRTWIDGVRSDAVVARGVKRGFVRPKGEVPVTEPGIHTDSKWTVGTTSGKGGGHE